MYRLVATHPLKNIALMGDVMTNTGHLLAMRCYRVPSCLFVVTSRDTMFSRRRLWRLLSSGMWRHVICKMCAHLSDYTASYRRGRYFQVTRCLRRV